MSKNFKKTHSVLIIIILIILLASCEQLSQEKPIEENTSTVDKKNETQNIPEDEEEDEEDEELEESNKVIVSENDIDDTNFNTILDSYDWDFDLDGNDEKVELLTSAKTDSTGTVMWDDGQEWKLRVKKENKEFVLFDDRIQIGTINHQIISIDDKISIAFIKNSTADFQIEIYTYNIEENNFEQIKNFNVKEGNINVLHDTFNKFTKPVK